MATPERRTSIRPIALTLGALSTAIGCTSILGIGGNFTDDGSGGVATGSTSSSGGNVGGGGAMSTSSSSASTSTGGSGGTGGTGGGFVETGAITGHSVLKQIDDQGNVIAHQFVDFSAGSTEVLEARFQKANGDWVTVNGIGAPGSDANGNFSIPATIDGPYILHIGRTWVALDNRDQLDLDTFAVANFSVPTLSDGNDPVAQYNVTGMRPWQDNDIVEFLQPASGVYSFISDPTVFSPPIKMNDTSITSTAGYVELTQDTHLIDSTVPVYVFHLSRYGTDPSATFDVTATNFAIPSHTTSERHVIIHNDQFEALAADFNPAATVSKTTLNFSLQPVPFDVAGQLVGTADLAAADPYPAGTATINVDFFFGNPFPPTWQLAGDYRTNVVLPVQASQQNASSINFTNGGCLMVDGDALLASSHPLVPQVHPAKNAKVDGAGFFGAGGPVSKTPKITWAAAAGATPTEILVQAMPVVPDGTGGSTVQQFGGGSAISVKGSATSVTLPPDFLAPATEYLFRIISYYSPKANHEQAPGRIPATLCFTGTVSNKFTTGN
jgi:hypothetical protein